MVLQARQEILEIRLSTAWVTKQARQEILVEPLSIVLDRATLHAERSAMQSHATESKERLMTKSTLHTFTVLITAVALTGCIKSAEVRTAENNLSTFVSAERSKYKSGCEAEGQRHIPVNLQRFEPDPPTLDNCSFYTTSMAQMICEDGNRRQIALHQTMRTQTYDANKKRRQTFVQQCIDQILSQDTNFTRERSRLESIVKAAEQKQATDPLKAFGLK